MNRFISAALLAAISTAVSGAAFGDTIKVGVIAPFSGPFAIYGKQYQEAIETYVAQNGSSAGEHEIEFIYKDVGGPNPDQSRSLAQELLIRDQVDYLAGFTFTPNALAVAPLIEQSQTPTVIFNAATSSINKESDFYLRTSYTLWQVSAPLAEWAYDQGMQTAATTVTDYGPGIDAENAFKAAFEAKGGKVVDAIRMPLSTTDFTPFIQRVRDAAPDAVFTFLPGGPPTFTYTKTYNENGLADAGIKFLGTAETEEVNLQGLGDDAIGLTTAYHYSGDHDSEANAAFKSKLNELFPDAVANWASVGAYDGTHLIYQMVEAAGSDGPAAVQSALGLEWESPRGPVSMDPEARTLVQNVYIREVERDAQTGELVNREQGIIATVGDLGWTQ
ncbi:amino acid/amide ABC transporter substrate-binding protein, HAAT family [Poseidonocella pacifica]|uniref:Amino acid/amide ABC transporter substrate-binding protein, HAAT family n=1 Tax=Poseidonocella pacifica TaxID=871651 RepID=A0A1I0VWA6_9RHOB|nr:ABC transporter substrate-binding protein [Poseidonocella pacifica]SFA80725.1 amino acid/amide ABC transporter substrate-binding protein, HAAT family [Poseidonocella pacifica]